MIGAGYLDTTQPRIGMVERQRTLPGKCVRFRRLSRIEGDAGRSLSAPIVGGIVKLNRAADAIRPDVEESCIGHGHIRPTRDARNRAWGD